MSFARCSRDQRDSFYSLRYMCTADRGYARGASVRRMLARELTLEDSKVQRAFERHPVLAQAAVEDLQSILDFLQKEARVALDSSSLHSALAKRPELLTASLDGQLRPALAALRTALPKGTLLSVMRDCPEALLAKPASIADVRRSLDGMGVSLPKLAKRTPRILLRDATSMQQMFDFLLDHRVGPGMAREQAAYVITSFPMLLLGTRSIERQLAPLVRFLREEMCVDPASQACLGFYAWPDALSVIQPAAKFLLEDCGYPPKALRADVSLLGYSLEARIFPRSQYVRKLAIPQPALRVLTAIDDQHFCDVVGSTLADYQEFAKELRKAARRKK